MKKHLTLVAALAAAALLAGCASGAASSAATSIAPPGSSAQSISTPQEETASQSTSQTERVETMAYRGEITQMRDDNIEVTQLPGHDYGQQSIIFHLGDAAKQDSDIPLAIGAYVEVTYNGVLTRSLPPQASAETLTVIAPESAGIVLNGVVVSVQPDGEDYRVTVLPFEDGQLPDESALDSAATDQHNILLVPADALEGLTAEALTKGTPVSAVTKGIAALSLPPQTPVIALLPYTVAEATA